MNGHSNHGNILIFCVCGISVFEDERPHGDDYSGWLHGNLCCDPRRDNPLPDAPQACWPREADDLHFHGRPWTTQCSDTQPPRPVSLLVYFDRQTQVIFTKRHLQTQIWPDWRSVRNCLFSWNKLKMYVTLTSMFCTLLHCLDCDLDNKFAGPEKSPTVFFMNLKEVYFPGTLWLPKTRTSWYRQPHRTPWLLSHTCVLCPLKGECNQF